MRSLVVPRGTKPRLDAFLASALPGVSLERARQLLAEGRVRVEGKVAKPLRKLWGGEKVEVELPAPRPAPRVGGPEISVLHEDAEKLVVNKPCGVVVEPDGNNPSLVELLATQRTGFDVEGVAAPGVVHRLDKETTGCVLLAKSDDAVAALKRAFEEKRIDKRYLALVLGAPPDFSELDTPFGHDAVDPRKYSSRVASPRRARLSFTVQERFADAALLEIALDTGRTHQIRVQLADAGYPVLADPVYGPHAARLHPAAQAIGRLALHAVRLSLDSVTWEAPLPADLLSALDLLRAGGMSRSP